MVTQSMKDKIENYILVIRPEKLQKNQNIESNFYDNQILFRQLKNKLEFTINGFFNPKYEIYLSKMGGFHLDLSYVKIDSQKLS